ncbi:cell division protein FtsB [Jezberella montanilacus]|jgi:cell division protein FtsB|uniref:Cell division protein FtsB n=1 Tax=Jezberella montanilacus TaxID=323426 RepID=A0A2T0XF27_9BURK|nr:cell division protein FtsB [Jezberella montanilacus]PRY97490.1 cell division protein FtsB [Jezberella montanilacus]|eukprot:gene3854-3903_t
MRLLFIILLALVALIQYPLWKGRGGWFEVRELQAQLAGQKSINEGLLLRNQALRAEISDLESGTEAAEERARGELGMMKRDEIFVQVLPPNVKPPMTKPVDTATSNVGTAKPNR